MAFDPLFKNLVEEIIDNAGNNGLNIVNKGKKLFRSGELGTEKIKNLLVDSSSKYISSSKNLKSGDIVKVSRGIYEHYGVYSGDDEVIHYTNKNYDMTNNTIMKTDFQHFLKDATDYKIVVFPKKKNNSLYLRDQNLVQDIQLKNIVSFLLEIFNSFNYKLYSPEETVARAESRLGEDKYNLIANNCEHFAIWCKTGMKKSKQVEKLINFLQPIMIPKNWKI